MKLVLKFGVAALCLAAIPASVSADEPLLLPQPVPTGCGLLPSEGALTLALLGAVGDETSGLDFRWGHARRPRWSGAQSPSPALNADRSGLAAA